MLSAAHITVAYGAHRALENVSIEVEKGEICVILGANGAGKTTLLKTIGGLVPSAPGALISIDGHDITQEKPHKIVEAGIALVPEGRGIFGDLSVADNLALGAYGIQARKGQAERFEEVLTLFPKLAERSKQIARTMSGGEQQMVAIGRALMSNPSILMLDEPSLGLSPILCTQLFKSLRAVRDTGVGILLVEQNAKQSLAIADRAYLLENGHITGQGRAEKMLNDPAVQAAYLGGGAGKRHKRFGEIDPPVIAAYRADAPIHIEPQTAANLAQKASAVQRAHIQNLRTTKTRSTGEIVQPARTVTEHSTMPNNTPGTQIDPVQLAKRASEISTAFVQAQRKEQRQSANAETPGTKNKKKSKSKKPGSSGARRIEKLTKKLTKLLKKQKNQNRKNKR